MNKYKSNKERQKAYRLRKKQAENDQKAIELMEKEDSSIMDIVSYFKTMNRIENVIPEQEQLLRAMIDQNIPNLLGVCGRGFSKTLIASTVAMWFADQFSTYIGKPIRVLLVSMNNEIFSYIDSMFLNDPNFSKRIRVEGRSLAIPQKEFSFSDNRSRVMRVIPSINSILSKRCDVLILDEAASIPTKVIKSALACLSGDSPNKVIMISTPHQVGSFFNDYVKKLPEGWTLQQHSSLLCPWAKTTIDRLRPILTEAEFEVQINGQIPKNEIIPLLKTEDIDACIEESVGLTLLPENKMLAGLDLAKMGERSLYVLTIVERTKGYDKVILVKSWKGNTPYDQVLQEASSIILGHNLGTATIRVQVDSKPHLDIDFRLKELCKFPIRKIDAATHAKLAEKTVINFSPTYKELMRTYLYTVVSNHKLKIARGEEELLYQLKNYRQGMIYGDDYVDSLMLCLTNFPQVSATGGRMTIINHNTGEVWNNYGNRNNPLPRPLGTDFTFSNQKRGSYKGGS